MSQRLSIAFLSHLASVCAPTGAEQSLALLARGLRERGHRVAVAAPGPWALEPSLSAAGVPVSVVPHRACWLTYWEPRPWPVVLAKWTGWIAGSFGARRRLAAFLDGFRPDVVHVNCLPHLSGAAASASVGRPVVWHLREILPPGRRRRWLASRLARHATRIVAVSEAVGGWVRDEGLGTKLSVIPNGVPASDGAAAGAAARAELGLPGDGVVVGLFGQLVRHKGALEFVRAGREALAARPELRFVLAGDGPADFRARVERAIETTGHAERFHLLPAQPSGARLIAAADCVCLATTTPDPLPRAVLEAMAASRPVVAFRSGGTAEMVVDGKTGLLVPVGDTHGLARALVELAGDPARREALGRAGAERARGEFSLDLHLDRMEAVLRSAAG